MAKHQTAPEAVASIRISQIICDWQSGPLRCVAQLAVGNTNDGVKAIWRNEVGSANCTQPPGTSR